MGFLWDEKLDNLDDEFHRVAASDNPDEQFYLQVEPLSNGKGGYEVFVGKPGAIERMKKQAAEEAVAALD